MSYSVDANLLLYASNSGCPEHPEARAFVETRAADPDVFCLAWPTVFAYLRIATHPAVFASPLTPSAAWKNLRQLMQLPRVCMIGEGEEFAEHYESVTRGQVVRGNLVPDAHLAAILHQHGVLRLYSADKDFLKFGFLKVINPLGTERI